MGFTRPTSQLWPVPNSWAKISGIRTHDFNLTRLCPAQNPVYPTDYQDVLAKASVIKGISTHCLTIWPNIGSVIGPENIYFTRSMDCVKDP